MPSPGPDLFSLLVAFGRSRFRLDESFVASTLSDILGGAADSFRVSPVEDRIFLFSCSCKKVGFEIYRLKSFKCVEFELFFQLFNDSGLAFARSHSSCSPVFPWQEVGKKRSYADAVNQPPLSGANTVKIGAQLHSKKSSGNRTSAHLLTGANRVSAGVRHIHSRVQGTSGPFHSSSGEQQLLHPRPGPDRTKKSFWRPKGVLSGRDSQSFSALLDSVCLQTQSQSGCSQDLNLNFDLNLEPPIHDSGISNVVNPPSFTVQCQRCHSSSHSRHECTAPIKCDKCLGWGHVAATCSENWKSLQDRLRGVLLDNFAKDFGDLFDYSSWFNPQLMTAGPTSPSILDCLDHPDDASASCIIPWTLQKTQPVTVDCTIPPENPNPSTPLLELHPKAAPMAYFRVNPVPFIPRRLNRMEVQGRKPMERVVLMPPRNRIHDLVIASIDPMPEHQVQFQAIRAVVTNFLNNGQRVEFTDMQPTHLRQAFVRFRNAFDEDRLIEMSPFQFGEISISFVDHNKGRNWQAVNFNRECWLLLLEIHLSSERIHMWSIPSVLLVE